MSFCSKQVKGVLLTYGFAIIAIFLIFPGGAAVARNPVKIKVVGSNPTRGATPQYTCVKIYTCPTKRQKC
jgi:hypothetical protein